MSVLSGLKDRVTKHAATPLSEIEARLREAEEALPTLEQRYAETAYRVELGEAPEREASAALGELRALRERIESLRAALGRARDIEAARVAEAKAAVFKSQLSAVRQHLSRRDNAVAKMCEHLQAAVDEYEKATAAAEKAVAAVPGAIMPAGSLCERLLFNGAIKQELYRLSARLIGNDPIKGLGRVFPGGAPATITENGRPDKIRPLTEQVKVATEHVMGLLSDRPVPVTVMPPAEPPKAQTHAPGSAGSKLDARNYTPPKVRMS